MGEASKLKLSIRHQWKSEGKPNNATDSTPFHAPCVIIFQSKYPSGGPPLFIYIYKK